MLARDARPRSDGSRREGASPSTRAVRGGMRVILRLAWRHLASRPRQTALTVAGVGLGVAVFIFTVAMMDGLVVFFTPRLIRVSPLLTVLPESLEVARGRDVLARAPRGRGAGALAAAGTRRSPDDTRRAGACRRACAQSPASRACRWPRPRPAVLAFGQIAEPASLLGVDPDDEATVTELPGARRCAAAGTTSAVRRDGAVVGVQLADRLGADVGDRVVATGETGAARELEVVGVLATGLGAYDEATALVNLPVAQGLAGWGERRGERDPRPLRRRSTGLGPLRAPPRGGHRPPRRDVGGGEPRLAAALPHDRRDHLPAHRLRAGGGRARDRQQAHHDHPRQGARHRHPARRRVLAAARCARVFLLEGVALGGAGAARGCAAAALVDRLLHRVPDPLRARARARCWRTPSCSWPTTRATTPLIAGGGAGHRGAGVAAARCGARCACAPVEVLRGAA